MATQNLTINNSIIGTEGAQLLVLLLDQVPDMENPGHWGSRLKSLFDSEWVTGFSSAVDSQKYPFQSNILTFRILFNLLGTFEATLFGYFCIPPFALKDPTQLSGYHLHFYIWSWTEF